MMAPATMSHQSVRQVSVGSGSCVEATYTVVLVNGECTSDEHRTKDGHVKKDQLPVRWTIVREDLELGVEVEVEEDCLHQQVSLDTHVSIHDVLTYRILRKLP